VTTVVHLTPTTFGPGGAFGGGERYPAELARAMSGLVPTKLIGFGTAHRFQHQGALSVETLPTRFRWRGADVNPISERMLGAIGRPDVLHLHQWESVTANLALLYGRLTGARVYATDHGGAGRNYWRRWRLHRLLTEFLPVSDFALSFYPELAGRATVIYGGVDPERFTVADRPRVRDVTVVGRLLPHKGIAELLATMPDGVSVHVVGRAYDPEYRDRLHALAVGRRVTFDESADDAAVIEAYRSSRVVVLASRDSAAIAAGHRAKTELLGLTLLEAMACGTPVVATDVGGMPEVIGDGVTGRIAPLADPPALWRALLGIVRADERRWQEMSRAARQHVEDTFTWGRVARTCLRAYGIAAPEPARR
jgi:glycosyltransferase involved in cell wall biosynthesis